MAKVNYQELFVQAFQDLHTKGVDWAYLPDVAQLAASHDEAYMRRRSIINKALGFIGVHRSELPDGHSYPPLSGLYPLINRMEMDGLVVGEFEEGEYSRRRMYRLTESISDSET